MARTVSTVLFVTEDKYPNNLFSGAYAIVSGADPADDIVAILNELWSGLNATSATKLANGLLDVSSGGGNITTNFSGNPFNPSISGDVYELSARRSTATAFDIATHRVSIATYIIGVSTASSSENDPGQLTEYWHTISKTKSISEAINVPTSAGTFNQNDTYEIQKKRTLSIRLSTAPAAIQSLRKKIIDNANLLLEDMKKYNFVEISEIIRVCTAMGIKRAYLRGLQHAIQSEEDIDRYIHRFNLRGALPFQDQTYPTDQEQPNWIGGGLFSQKAFTFYEDDDNNKTHSIMLQCIKTDGDVFIQCKDSTVDFVQSGNTLPLTAFIPKYREEGFDSDIPWLPFIKCSILNNIPDSENCVSTMDIASGALDKPDVNILIPAGTNQFPYITPNQGFPYSKLVNPEPKPIRMIMDGSPIEGEEILLQNKFELTGSAKFSPGDDGIATIQGPIGGDTTSTVTPSGGTNLNDGDVVIIPDGNTFPLVFDPETGNFISSTIIDGDYTGPILVVRDPIVGDGTRFNEELAKGDVIELSFPDRVIGGSFFTNGTSTIYYSGTDFLRLYKDNMKLVLSGVEYTVTSKTYDGDEIVTQYNGLAITHNATFTIRPTFTIKSEDVARQTSLFSGITETVSLLPTPANRRLGVIEFANINYDTNNSFEIGDLILINNIEYRFQSLEGNRLQGVYRVDGTNIDNGISNATLTRATKTSRALLTLQGGMLPTYKMYYTIDTVSSNTAITVTPPYGHNRVYEGKINRIGFNIQSNSQSPDLINNGFDVEGVGQFLLRGTSTGTSEGNSQTFLVPAAATEKVILYRGTDFTRSGTDSTLSALTAKDVVSVPTALNSFLSVYNYSSFAFSQDTPIYAEDVANYETFQDITDEKKLGVLYFTDGEDPYIILETMKDNNPVSHGFAEGDILTIRKIRYEPLPDDDPYGDLVSYSDSTLLYDFDYSHCGLEIEVADIVNPHRFKILKNGKSGTSSTNIFFKQYDDNTTHYLTATNGSTLEYWSKYFKPVFMDGTVTANSANEYATSNPTRTFTLTSKGDSGSDYYFNYNATATTFNHKLGSTAINVEMNGNRVNIEDGAGSTEDGTFILSFKTPLNKPPNIMDSFLLKLVEFEEVEIE